MIDRLFEKIKKNEDYEFSVGKYSIDREIDGVFLIKRNKFVIFFHKDGIVYKLTEKWKDKDWSLHCHLYEKTINQNNFLIDIPISSTNIHRNHKIFNLSIVQRPGNSYGISFINDCINNQINNQYFLDYIDQTYIGIMHLNFIRKKYDSGVPIDIFDIYQRYQNHLGYFWVDFKEWDHPIENLIDKKIKTLYSVLNTVNNYELDKNLIMHKAESQWKL